MAFIERYVTADGPRYRVGWRADGKKHHKTFIRSKDAQAFKVEVERQAQLGTLFATPPQTFGEFAGLSLGDDRVIVDDSGADSWFGRYKPTVSASAYRRRRDSAQHLRDLIGVRFADITPALVEDTVLQVAFDHPRTAVIVSQTIKKILRAAKVRGQVVRQEAIDVKPPRHTPSDKRFLTPSEVETIAKKAEDEDEPQLANLIRFLALTGLRIHEALNLIDADVTDKAVQVGRSKSDAGRRSVPLAASAKPVVLKQKMVRSARATTLFPSPRGMKAHLSHTNARLKRVRKAAGMEDVTFHSFRHTFATGLVAANIHPRQAADLMGHNDKGALFMRTYGHLYANAAEKAMEQFDAYLQEAK